MKFISSTLTLTMAASLFSLAHAQAPINQTHDNETSGRYAFSTDGMTSNFLFSDEITFSDIKENKFTLSYKTNHSSEAKTVPYDQKYYAQFQATVALAKSANALLFIKNSNWPYTDRYDVNIASMEWPADDLVLTKVLPHFKKKIVISTRSTGAQVAPVCYGCSQEEINLVYLQLNDILQKAKHNSVLINLGFQAADTIQPLPKPSSHFAKLKTYDPKTLVMKDLYDSTGNKCGWSFWANLQKNESGESIGNHLNDICLGDEGLGRALIPLLIDQTQKTYERLISLAILNGKQIRLYDGITVENVKIYLGITHD